LAPGTAVLYSQAESIEKTPAVLSVKKVHLLAWVA
jgi:hypothetical protein